MMSWTLPVLCALVASGPGQRAPAPAAAAVGAVMDDDETEAEPDAPDDEGSITDLGLTAGTTMAFGAAGAILGTATATGLLLGAFALGGVPDPASNDIPVLLIVALPLMTVAGLATPGVGAAVGAVVGTLLGGGGPLDLTLRPIAAYLGAVVGLLVCALPSWWVCGAPVMVAGLFVLPDLLPAFLGAAIGGAACVAGTGSAAVAGAAAAGTGWALRQSDLGPTGSEAGAASDVQRH